MQGLDRLVWGGYQYQGYWGPEPGSLYVNSLVAYTHSFGLEIASSVEGNVSEMESGKPVISRLCCESVLSETPESQY